MKLAQSRSKKPQSIVCDRDKDSKATSPARADIASSCKYTDLHCNTLYIWHRLAPYSGVMWCQFSSKSRVSMGSAVVPFPGWT